MRIWFVILMIFLFLVSIEADAPCSMCKAVVESDQETGSGINGGILYIMGIPYLLLTALGIYFFRKPLAEKWKQFKGE